MGGREAPVADPGRARATLSIGVAVFRWAALAWMAVAALASRPFANDALALAALAAATAWTIVATPRYAPRGASRTLLAADLAVAAALVVASALVVPRDSLGARPFFATAYPAAAVLAWAVHGMRAGLAAAAVVGAALVASRPLNGMALGDLTSAQAQSLANGVITYLLAGGAVGFVADLLARSARDLAQATAERLRQTHRAARLAERTALGRQIHDSVLQALAIVHKRGRELAAAEPVDPAEVRRLAELAGDQERELRALVMRDDVEPPEGSADVRDTLEALALGYAARIPVEVSSSGPAFLPRAAIEQIDATVRQAIDNVVEHARARRVTVFVEPDGGGVAITVRDDGAGFDVASANGFGLRSMRGRIEDLGGRFSITSRPGGGTEIEMIVPAGSE